MDFHVFELAPSDKMGVPNIPLTLHKQVSNQPFLDYEKGDLENVDLIRVFGEGLTDSEHEFSVCQAKSKSGESTLVYVKITGRVVFIKEIGALVYEIKDVEKLLKDTIGPLTTSHQGGNLAETIRKRLNFQNALTDFEPKPHSDTIRLGLLVDACFEHDLDKQQVICGDFDNERRTIKNGS